MSGIEAVQALEAMRRDPHDARRSRCSSRTRRTWATACCCANTEDVHEATPEKIERAVDSTVPRVAPLFWGFRLMVGLGFLPGAVRAVLLVHGQERLRTRPWLLKWALWVLPLPWIASELGWFVAEYGRQPWTMYGVLPTHMSVVDARRRKPVRLDGGFRRLLHPAAGGRALPDVQVRAHGSGQPGHRPLCQRAHPAAAHA